MAKIVISHVFRERHYYHHDFCKWFEECPVVAQSAKFITVKSETYSTIHYPGGEFRLEIAKLKSQGYHHHTRHGERFWLEKPEQGDLFPTQQLLETPSVLEYEAEALGWDIRCPRPAWEQWQKDCFILASCLKRQLKEVVDIWKFGGESALQRLWEEVRNQDPLLNINREL